MVSFGASKDVLKSENIDQEWSQVFKLDYAEHICINWNAMCVCFEKQMNHPNIALIVFFYHCFKTKTQAPFHVKVPLHC